MGTWYVTASLPEKGRLRCEEPVSYYRLAEKGLGFTMLDTCFEGEKFRTFPAKAEPAEYKSRTKFRLRHSFWKRSDHHILLVDKDFRWAVVGSADRKRLRILSRNPEVPKKIYSLMYLKLEGMGFDTEKIVGAFHSGRKPPKDPYSQF